VKKQLNGHLNLLILYLVGDMSDQVHVFRFLVTPKLDVEPQPKRRLWKMAHSCQIAIKVQRLNDDEQTRLAIRGTFANCRTFAANLEHCSTRPPVRFSIFTEVNKSSNPESDYQKHFCVDQFDVFDDGLGGIFLTPHSTGISRPGSSGGAGAPPQPSVYDTDSAGSASASTIRRQLEIAQEAVDEANDSARASAMEAARLRNEAAAAAGREAAERRAREAAEAQAAQDVAARQAAEAQAAQDVAARQAAEAQAAEALAEVVRLKALLASRS